METESPRERELRGRGTRRYQLPMHDEPTVKLCECGCGKPAPIATKTSKAHGRVKGQPSRFILGHAFRGRHHSEEVAARIVAAHKGVKRSPEVVLRMSGNSRSTWKGENVSYFRLHAWLLRWKTKTGKCTECGREAKTEWANISGEYRRDLDDFRELCIPCHRRLDRQRGARKEQRFAS